MRKKVTRGTGTHRANPKKVGKSKPTISRVEQVRAVAEDASYAVDQIVELPGRPARLAAPPSELRPEILTILKRKHPEGLYSHQAEALRSLCGGADVCLATSTASGKSLVFQALGAHLILGGPGRVLAVYPAKALIQDQIEKWRELVGSLDIPVNYVHGGVPVDRRFQVVAASRVLLMTPDVLHAWLMARLTDASVASFLQNLRLMVLDEAHVYEGAFGTNMAFLLRRLQAVSPRHQLVCSTATVDDPGAFIERLTGRKVMCFAPAQEGTPTPAKTIILCQPPPKRFEAMRELVVGLMTSEIGRFLAFADSRRMVEQLVAAAHRPPKADEGSTEEDGEDGDDGDATVVAADRVLPYRAGYENADRERIQSALQHGTLAGVVSTSALELGLDIGEIDLVVLLTRPPTMKAFWQRLGRAGRRRPGVCLFIDDTGSLQDIPGILRGYLAQPVEPNWLYLENRYIQYTHALCAAHEVRAVGDRYDRKVLKHLPRDFGGFLQNELDPTDLLPADLFPLKQAGQEAPHLAFPLRNAAEPSFQVLGPADQALGSLSYSQVVREAYPGAIYYYMARPFRVFQLRRKDQKIRVKRAKRWITRPLNLVKVFPDFRGAPRRFLRSESGFVAEVDMQVSERVTGFIEKRGPNAIENRYGAGSPYSQQDVQRFFQTTGVCWWFDDDTVMTEAVASSLLEAFCALFGVQSRDTGVGDVFSKRSPVSDGELRARAIYDATHGSLRLTERLGAQFDEVVGVAIKGAVRSNDAAHATCLRRLRRLVKKLTPQKVKGAGASAPETGNGNGWVEIIAAGERALYTDDSGVRDVEVLGHLYTRQGVLYKLKPVAGTSWMVAAGYVQPIKGETRMRWLNVDTGEERE